MAYKGSCNTLENTGQYEPIFVLVARDQTAPAAVRDWINRARQAGVPEWKLHEAEGCANSMEIWQRDHPSKVKVPD